MTREATIYSTPIETSARLTSSMPPGGSGAWGGTCAGDRETRWIEETDLHEHTRLIPNDMLV